MESRGLNTMDADFADYEDIAPIVEETEDAEFGQSLDALLQEKLSRPVRLMHDFMLKGAFGAGKGDARANVIDNTAKRTYIIPMTHIPAFFDHLEACRMDGQTMHYAERQATQDITHTGIAIDIDIFQKGHTRIVTDQHLRQFITKISRILAETLDLSDEADSEFTFHAFVISRTAVTPYDETSYKDGFHLIIPEVRVSRAYKRYLIERLVKNGVIESTFKNIMGQITKPEKFLDKQSACNPINFVGSAKANNIAYPLTHAFIVQVDRSDVTPSAQVTPLPVDPLAHGEGPYGKINLAYELSLGFSLPEIGGHRTWLAKCDYDYTRELESEIKLHSEKTQGGILDEDEVDDNEADVDILATCNAEAAYLKKLLEIIDISYATEYEKWIKVIFAIAHTNVRYKPLAIYFSHRNPKAYSPVEIERVWNEGLAKRSATTTQTPVTKRSIIFWARESSPEKFRDIEQENYLNILARAVYRYAGEISHAECARVLYSMAGDKFACDTVPTDTKTVTRTWYEFVLPEQRHLAGQVYKWRHEDDPDALRRFIADKLPDVYDVQLTRVKERCETAETENNAKFWGGVEKRLKASQVKLGDDRYQKSVMNQCMLQFRVIGFVQELDSYTDVIGVGNGVLKLGLKPQLIQRFHEYKISKFTTTHYVPYNPNNQYVRELMNVISDIIVEHDAREYILFYCCTFLTLAPVSAMLLYLKGSGQNGKTWLLQMLQYTLGEQYIATVRPQLLVGLEAKANEANSALMVLRGKTGGVCDEFKATDKWNTAAVKTIANPGRSTGRDLREKEASFRNTANLLIAANHDISTEDTDHGFWRRIYYYLCRTKFTACPDPNNPQEKLVKPEVQDVYPYSEEYRSAFLSILVHYYSRLHSEYGGDIKNVSSRTITQQSEEYRDRQDTLNKFINLHLVKSPDSEPILLTTFCEAYHSWYDINVRQGQRHDCRMTIAKLENSKIKDWIGKENHKEVVLGHRLLISSDDMLQPGEEFLFTAYREEPQAAPGTDDATVPRPKTLPLYIDDDDLYVDNIAELQTPEYYQDKGREQTARINAAVAARDAKITEILAISTQ